MILSLLLVTSYAGADFFTFGAKLSKTFSGLTTVCHTKSRRTDAGTKPIYHEWMLRPRHWVAMVRVCRHTGKSARVGGRPASGSQRNQWPVAVAEPAGLARTAGQWQVAPRD